MALERPYEAEQIVRNRLAERQARRDYWRDMLRTLLHLVFWVLAGLALMGAALHTNDRYLGKEILWPAGQLVWLSGTVFTLLAAYRRGERRGDW